MHGLTVRRLLAAVLAAGLLVGCGPLQARVSDTWSRSYPLAAAGEIKIVNINGRIEVEGVEGSTVDVQAERMVSGATDSMARDLLARIVVDEHATPDLVSLETRRIEGMLLGVRYEVRYHVKAPKAALVRANLVNGGIVLNGLDGRVVAHATNGGIEGRGLTGGVEASTTNGGINLTVASVGKDPIELKATNGGVRLHVPSTAKATVSASVANGRVRVSGPNLEPTEQSRKSFEGRLNGGGTQILLRTTNGGVVMDAGL